MNRSTLRKHTFFSVDFSVDQLSQNHALGKISILIKR